MDGFPILERPSYGYQGNQDHKNGKSRIANPIIRTVTNALVCIVFELFMLMSQHVVIFCC